MPFVLDRPLSTIVPHQPSTSVLTQHRTNAGTIPQPNPRYAAGSSRPLPESIIMAVRHEMQWPFSKKTCLYAFTTRRHLPKPLLHDVGTAAQKVQPAKRHTGIGSSTPQNPLTCHSSHLGDPDTLGRVSVPSASFRVHQCDRWHLGHAPGRYHTTHSLRDEPLFR